MTDADASPSPASVPARAPIDVDPARSQALTGSDPSAADGIAALPHWGVIVARGEDAASFLHGQLTQDVSSLSAGQARLAGYCSPKGRLLASFVVWRCGDGSLALACSADVLAPTLKRLSMFVLRARCNLADATAELPLWGLTGEAAGRALGPSALAARPWDQGVFDGSSWLRLPDAAGVPRWMLAGTDAPARLSLPEVPSQRWQLLEVCSGLPRITAATADHFVPQMVNFELVGGVNFKKGCYPGQEVVARSQYRGTLKRRLFLMTAHGELAPGTEVFHSDDPSQPAGEVVNAAAGPDGTWAALVEAKLALVEAGGSFHAAGGPSLTLSALPYSIPKDAD